MRFDSEGVLLYTVLTSRLKEAPLLDSREKMYHIYLKNECVLHSLDEKNFKSSWDTLQNLVGLVKTDYVAEDLSYEVVNTLHKGEDISN